MTYEQLKEKYGKNWGLEDPREAGKPTIPAPTIDQLREHYKRFGLSFKPKVSRANSTIEEITE